MPELLLPRSLGAAWLGSALVVQMGCMAAVTRPALQAGVSWELAQLRAATLSDIEYAYRLTVPRARDTPVTGTLVAEFEWSDDRGRDLVLDFKDARSARMAQPSSGV